MKEPQDDWMERLAETYRVPTKEEIPNKVLTEEQLKIIKDGKQ